jgi:hypothetical protein
MTQPQFLSPNPGGQNRRLVRTILANWIIAQRIAGIDHVYLAKPMEWRFEAWAHTGTGFGALVAVRLSDDSEDRTAYTGPTDPGGKTVHYAAELRIKHWSYELDDAQDDPASEDDYDRIVDALKDCLRGPGRDLGRPEIVIAAGEWPRQGGITSHHEEPIVNEGSVLREGTISFTVSQYLPTLYPGT